jgi:hypothetical protein
MQLNTKYAETPALFDNVWRAIDTTRIQFESLPRVALIGFYGTFCLIALSEAEVMANAGNMIVAQLRVAEAQHYLNMAKIGA